MMPLVVVPAPTEEGRHYATETIQTQSGLLPQQKEQETRDVDEVSDTEDFLRCNVCALLFCFPIAFVGLFVSLFCQCAKSYDG